tara:strand:- start:1167 stop:1559 length:393 start_codon:yes stop_codon:yes gene_type:complete
MEIINLIEVKNSLYLIHDEKQILLSKENFDDINSSHVVINNEVSLKVVKSNINLEELDNINMVSVNPVTSALKLIEKDKIIKHLDRKNYLTISYPIIATKKDLFSHLISNNFFWDLDLFIKNNKFKIINF